MKPILVQDYVAEGMRFGASLWAPWLQKHLKPSEVSGKSIASESSETRKHTKSPTKEYYLEFYHCLDLPEVLVLCYEDLQESVAGRTRLG